MKTMMKTLGLALASLIVLPATSWAQGMGQQGAGTGTGANKQNPPPTGQQPAAPPAAPKIDPEEEKGFKALTTITTANPKDVAQKCDEFMQKYPDSHYATQIYALSASAYMQMNDSAKAQEYGRKSLDKYPLNVDALAVMAVVLSRSFDASQPGAAQKLAEAEKFARTGIDQLTSLQRPTDQVEADFTKMRDSKLAMCYSALGLVEYDQNKSTDAALQFSEAIKRENPPEPVDQYLLGMALMDTKQYAGAVTAFQDCLKDPGPMQKACDSQLTVAKKNASTQLTSPKQ